MKYYIIAGEASGDLHGSNLMTEIIKRDPNAAFRYFGGDLMKSRGGTLVKHYREMAYMGLFDVLKNIRTILKNMRFCKQDLLTYHPDMVIFIDFPGFNLKVAKFASKHKFHTIYYISPKIWAWKRSRVHDIKKYIDQMFVILPFEVDFYKQYDYDVDYVGNPVLDAVNNYHNKESFEDFCKAYNLTGKPIVALLAGSRKQEIDALLPEMLEVVPFFPGYQFVLAAAPSIDISYYCSFNLPENLSIIENQTYRILSHARAALVTSGTATLETALFNVPEVVCYKTNILQYRLGKIFVKIRFFSLVNLIMEKEVVKELLQFELSSRMKSELDEILHNDDYRQNMLSNFKLLRQKLDIGNTAELLAKKICKK